MVSLYFFFNDTATTEIYTLSLHDALPIFLESLPPRKDGHWLTYVAGVMWAMRKAGMAVGGLDLAIASDLPIAAGLSSSAAIEMAVARAACAATDLEWDAASMARIGQIAENQYVGVSCGIMNQFASAASV